MEEGGALSSFQDWRASKKEDDEDVTAEEEAKWQQSQAALKQEDVRKSESWETGDTADVGSK